MVANRFWLAVRTFSVVGNPPLGSEFVIKSIYLRVGDVVIFFYFLFQVPDFSVVVGELGVSFIENRGQPEKVESILFAEAKVNSSKMEFNFYGLQI